MSNSSFEESLEHTDLNVKCPLCGLSSLRIFYRSVDVPYIGAMLVSTIICNNCGFKVSDFWMIFEEGKYEDYQSVRVTQSTMGDLVCASTGSKIIIPEIDTEIQVITFDAQHITTIEGVLRELKTYVEAMLDTAEDKTKAKKILDVLNEELENPSGRLTLMLSDPKKHSAVIPREYWVRRVEQERKFPKSFLDAVAGSIIEKWKSVLKNFNP